MARAPRHEEPLKRPSTLVDRLDLPGVRAREELTRLLRAHDPEAAAEYSERISAEHLPLLRQMARETPDGASDPVVRRHAIALLAKFPDPDAMNLLADLARFDRDPAVRGEALLGLGHSGVKLAAPILGAALASPDGVEAAAAAKAVRALAERVGGPSVRAGMGTLRKKEAMLLERALAEPVRRPGPRTRRHASRSLSDPKAE
jgi:HEAT repeat protein